MKNNTKKIFSLNTSFLRIMFLCSVTMLGNVASANPTGGQFVFGSGSIVPNGSTLTINTGANNKSIINWNSFSIDSGQKTIIVQPSATSQVLNRVTGNSQSNILGSLQSNGGVFLINRNGIFFGSGAQVNLPQLVASTLAISDGDFIAGNYKFTFSTNAVVANSGSIDTSKIYNPNNPGTFQNYENGRIYLLAPNVDNLSSGTLKTNKGIVGVAAGRQVLLGDITQPNIQLLVTSNAGDRARNLGKILANAGTIGIYGALVQQKGELNADSAIAGQNGKIILSSKQNTTLDTNSNTHADGISNGVGGFGNAGTIGVTSNVAGLANVDDDDDKGVVLVNAGAKISANGQNNGGNMSLWSSNSTLFHGQADAKSQTGTGGNVTIGSDNYLDFHPTGSLVDVSGAVGKTGQVLLGANRVIILSANSSDNHHQSANATSFIDTKVLTNELGKANVVIQAKSTLANNPLQTNTITVNATPQQPLTWGAANSTNSLALLATSDITINSPVSAPNNTLGLFSAQGNITQGSNGSINTKALSAVAQQGSVILNNNNDVATLAGSAANGFQFTNAPSFNIEPVNTVSALPGPGFGEFTIMPITVSWIISPQSTQLTSLNGAIQTINGASIVGGALGLVAKTGIGSTVNPLATSVASLSAQNSSNNIVIDNTQGNNPVPTLTLTGIQNTTGNVVVKTDKALTVSNAISTNGSIALTAFGDMNVNATVTASGGANLNPITLTSNLGSINTGNAGRLIGNQLTLSAQTGIGSVNNPLKTSVGSVLATNNNNDMVIDNANSTQSVLTLNKIQNGTGNIFINTDKALTAQGIISTTGDIGLSATDAVNINSQIAANATIGPVQPQGHTIALESRNGSITENNTGSLSSWYLVALAKNGGVNLGNTQNGIEKAVSGQAGSQGFTLAASDIHVGSVAPVGPFISHTLIDGITANAGDVTLTALPGKIDGNSLITGVNLTLSALTGIGSQSNPLNISVNRLSATNDTNDIAIKQAGQALTIDNLVNGANPGFFNRGGIYVNADNTMTVAGPVRNETFHDNVIYLHASQDMALQGDIIKTKNPGSVMLVSDNGNIIQTQGAIQSNRVGVSALHGLVNLSGSNAIGELAGESAGNFSVNSTQGFVIDTVGPVGLANTPFYHAAISGINAGGNVSLGAAGSIDIAQNILARNQGSVILNSGSVINQTGIIEAGSLLAQATQGVNLNQANKIVGANQAPGLVGGSTTQGDFIVTNVGSMDIAPVGVTSTQGNVTLTSLLGDITNGAHIQAINGNVLMSALSGSIKQTGNGSITANRANLVALNGIGSQNAPLNVRVNELSATNGTNGAGGGDIAIANNSAQLNVLQAIQGNGGNIFIDGGSGSLTTSGLVSTGNGDIGLRTAGDIHINSQVQATGNNAIVGLSSAQGNIDETGTIRSTYLSALAGNGNVNLANPNNQVSYVGGVSGGPDGFIFANNQGLTIGAIAAVGPNYLNGPFIPAVNGVNAGIGKANISTHTGNLTINGPIYSDQSITLTVPNGSIVQGNQQTNITTPGILTLLAGNDVGASGTGSLLTSIGGLDVKQANNIYIQNTSTNLFTLYEALGKGVVDIRTLGALLIPNGNGGTNLTGNTLTIVAGGNLTMGANNTIAANAINIYTGYTGLPGSTPVSNGANTTLVQNGTVSAQPINFWANTFAAFVNGANTIFTSTPHYFPSGLPTPPNAPYVPGLDDSNNFLQSPNKLFSNGLINIRIAHGTLTCS